MVKTLLDLSRYIEIKHIRDSLEILFNHETNLFAQVFIQQQIIVYEMASSISEMRYIAKYKADEPDRTIILKEIPDKEMEKYINDNTLGGLYKLFKIVIPKKDEKDIIHNLLEKYIEKRNDLTHNMTIKFKTIDGIYQSATETITMGNTVLKFFHKFDLYLSGMSSRIANDNVKRLTSLNNE